MSFSLRFPKLSSINLFLSLFFLSNCAQQPVLSRKAKQNVRITSQEKTPSIKIKTTPPVVLPIIKEIPLEMKTKLPIKPPLPISNISELKKNISNDKISTDLIENSLSISELESVAIDSFFISIKPQVLLKLGKTYQKNQLIEKATEYFKSITTLFPQSPYSTQAIVLLSTIHLTSDVDAKVIGAILPLTGKNASLGQHALNAIRMGLDLNRADNKLRLALFDSQSNPEFAAKGVEKLVKDDKAIVILGGFSAKEAAAIASRAELLTTPYIGFSQKSGLTNIGEYVFRNSVTAEMQVDKLVQFAFEKLSAKKFAILFPNDSYGVEFSNIFWDHILARGGEVTAAQTYDPKETDFSETIQKLVGTYYVEARSDEYAARVRELKELKELKETKETKQEKSNQKVVTKKNTRDHWSEESILPPIVDFDVLFVPDSSRALGQILAFMKYNEVKDINYLGTNIWNSPDLPKRVANQASGVYFVDALDITQGAGEPAVFFKEYLTLYSEEPTMVEVQSYEAAKIVKDLLSSGTASRNSLARNLRSLGTTIGVTGELKMSKQREIERPIYVLTLVSGLVKKVE